MWFVDCPCLLMSHANTHMGTPYTQTHSHTCSFSKMALSTSCMLSFTCKMASCSRCSREVLGKGGEGGGKENKATNKQTNKQTKNTGLPSPQLSIAYTVLYVETHIFDCTVVSLSSSSALSPFSSAASLCTASSLERHHNQTRGHPPN